jgi:hypothetical protein
MLAQVCRGKVFIVAWLGVLLAGSGAMACCPVSLFHEPVVNADQTVIMIWDAEHQMQHFIRQASFKSQGDNFGFLVPTPTQPELEESGDAAFAQLEKITAPEVQKVWRPVNPFSCGLAIHSLGDGRCASAPTVHVLEEKRVAGFNAVVLEANATDALVGWLKDHEYAYSPEIAEWAKPYIEQGWKITALKVAKDPANKESKDVAASALRISFRTSRPLFPYREPDMRAFASDLHATKRMLRIYFLAEGRYEGQLTRDNPWTGEVVWAGKLSQKNRTELLGTLRLPAMTGPREWYLTEFEDNWPYRPAPADVYFRRSASQDNVRRAPIIQYVQASYPTDVTVYALATMMVVPVVWTRVRRRKGTEPAQTAA